MLGGGKVAKSVNITQLKNQLLEKIDIEDLVQLEKVERYIELVKSFRAMSKVIKKDGESAAIKTIGERNKINASLLSIEKSFDFKVEDTGHRVSDLI
jgi:flagellar hook assembly protein FlgD